MSTENEEAKVLQEQQLLLVRNSLINEVFSKYHVLIDSLKKLPIYQQLPGMTKAYLDIDTGMIWVKEILSTTQLIFSAPPTPPIDPPAITGTNTDDNVSLDAA